MGLFPQPRPTARPRERLAAFLDERYRGRPQALATDLNVSAKRAENLLAGHWPADDLTLAAIMVRFGRDAWEAIFSPDIDKTRARLAAEVRALEEHLEERTRLLREAGGAVGRDQGGQVPYDGQGAP